MKKVLMIAHQFPPIGGSGVQRTVKFVKYLPMYGWEGVVFTRETKRAQLTDETLKKDIPDDTAIYRSKAWDLSEAFFPLYLAGKLVRRRILIPDGERLWQIFSKKKAIEIVENEDIQMLYSSSQPFSTHLLAMALKKNFPHIPWVADFRDEWSNNAFVKAYHYRPSRVRKEIRMERNVFEMADSIVMNTPFMRDNSARDNPDLENKFYVIPNGYDREDFEDLANGEQNDRFILTYTGLIYGNTSPETVFMAVSKLIKEKRIDPGRIRMRFIGRLKGDTLYKLAELHDVADVVEILPYLPHRKSIQQLMVSDAVLLLLGEGTDAIYTGKLMEYINTGKPIMASIPEKGAAAALIRETNTGLVADCKDVETTARHISALYEAWEQKKDIFSPNMGKISQFERRELTKKLAEIFDGLC